MEINKQYSFAAVKAEYAKSVWKKEGTAKDKNGKILNKLSQTIPMKQGKKDGKSVSAATEEQSASMEEIAASSRILAKMAEELQVEVRKFKI